MQTLSLANISAGYQNKSVLHDVSLEIESAMILALVGPNGSGKSTLIRVATGVLPATCGRISMKDANVLRMNTRERARRIAVVPQQAQLPNTFTVSEVFLMGRTPHIPMWASDSRKDYEAVEQAMRASGIESLSSRRIGELSGGDRKSVV